MTRIAFRCAALAVVIWLGAAVSPSAWGQEPGPTLITLHPAAEPEPVLKHRFTVKFADRLPGNAAVYYGRVTAEQTPFFTNRALRDNVDRWQTTPLEELRREKAQVGFPTMFIENAVRCRDCDWQLPMRSLFENILLPDVQQMRQHARYMAAEARIAIANGDYDEALKHIGLSYAMARQIAQGETLVHGLIGAAVCGVASRQTLELIQQPDAPNLYWALTVLPQPMIDFNLAMDAESCAFEMAMPELTDPAQPGRTADQWQATLEHLWRGINESLDPPNERETLEAFAARCEKVAPLAFSDLVARGWKSEKLLEMPRQQVLVIHAMTIFRELNQQSVVAFALPYPEAMRRISAISDRVKQLDSDGGLAVPLMRWGMTGIKPCRTASARVDRELAALRVLEAMRIYAAHHDGKLPGRLRDIAEVPVPLDPVTGEEFQYSLVDGTARMTSPAIGESPALNYEIKMAAAQ